MTFINTGNACHHATAQSERSQEWWCQNSVHQQLPGQGSLLTNGTLCPIENGTGILCWYCQVSWYFGSNIWANCCWAFEHFSELSSMCSTSVWALYNQAVSPLWYSTLSAFGRTQRRGTMNCQNISRSNMARSSWTTVREFPFFQLNLFKFKIFKPKFPVHANQSTLCQLAHLNKDINWVIDSMDHALYAKYPRLRYYPGYLTFINDYKPKIGSYFNFSEIHRLWSDVFHAATESTTQLDQWYTVHHSQAGEQKSKCTGSSAQRPQ